MKVKIVKRYKKRTIKGSNPMTFRATQPKGVNTNVYAVVLIDPILRKHKHKDLRKAMLKHEEYELKDWGKGCTKAHHHAKKRESKLTRNMSVDGFWREIERRNKRGK